MARRKKGQAVSGWINLDKPYDITSTHAVSRVRRLFDAQKAGHAGTLDPLATGILPALESSHAVAYAERCNSRGGLLNLQNPGTQPSTATIRRGRCDPSATPSPPALARRPSGP